MPRIPHQSPFDNPFDDHPMHADVKRELAGQDELHVIAARRELQMETRAFEERERNDIELQRANWLCFLP